MVNRVIELDDESIQMIEDFEHFEGDESYASHLAYKILELWKAQS